MKFPPFSRGLKIRANASPLDTRHLLNERPILEFLSFLEMIIYDVFDGALEIFLVVDEAFPQTTGEYRRKRSAPPFRSFKRMDTILLQLKSSKLFQSPNNLLHGI